MRTILFFLLIVVIPFHALHGQDEALKPDSLLNWLRIIDLEGYETLSAYNQNGYYFSVRVDADGDVLFAYYEHSTDPKNQRNSRSFSTRITDEKGKNLYDGNSNKKNPKATEIEYSTKKNVGPIKVANSITVAFTRGSIYPLKNHTAKRLKVQYIEKLDEGQKRILLDQWIVMPEAKHAK